MLIRRLVSAQTSPFFPGFLRYNDQESRIPDSGHNVETPPALQHDPYRQFFLPYTSFSLPKSQL